MVVAELARNHERFINTCKFFEKSTYLDKEWKKITWIFIGALSKACPRWAVAYLEVASLEIANIPGALELLTMRVAQLVRAFSKCFNDFIGSFPLWS